MTARSKGPDRRDVRTERGPRAGNEGEPVAVPTWSLSVAAGPDKGRTVTFSDRRVWLGTSRVCDLRLTDVAVSRRHLAVIPAGNRLRIEDLDSTNGTFVKGVRVLGALTSSGDVIEIGRTLLCAVASGPSGSTAAGRSALSFGSVLGVSSAMQRVFQLARSVAESEEPCLIEGSTGTGKERLAESIHEMSERSNAPFVLVDCTSVATAAMEAWLFGNGGPEGPQPGAFEKAAGGTLFIDEVADLDPALQARLVRVLEQQAPERRAGSGSRPPAPMTARVLAASRRSLDIEVQEGRFREDLYQCLTATRIELPTLAERGRDVELLARHFWNELGGEPGAFPLHFLRRFAQYSWPGNVRELLHEVLGWHALADSAQTAPVVDADVVSKLIANSVPFTKARQLAIEDFERRYVQSVLDRHEGNVTRAARASGIGRRYFHVLLNKGSR